MLFLFPKRNTSKHQRHQNHPCVFSVQRSQVVFALVGFSYVVGSITGSLGQLRSMLCPESASGWDSETGGVVLGSKYIQEEGEIRIV